MVFQKLFGFPNALATKHMLEVHLQGRSIVARGPKEKCEYDLARLSAAGLTAKMEEA
jgi:ATP-dependent Clp protease adaptor protein ClpS